jgi:hypothetical protein
MTRGAASGTPERVAKASLSSPAKEASCEDLNPGFQPEHCVT